MTQDTAMTDRWRVDPVVLGVTLSILCLGVWSVYSSSAAFALRHHGDGAYFLKRQLVWAGLGLLAAWWSSQVPVRRWAVIGPWLLVGGIVLGLVTFAPGLGHEAGGQRRWLRFLGVGVQPSELAKVGLVLTLAVLLARRSLLSEDAHTRTLIGPVLVAQVPILVVLPADFGTAVVMECVVAAMVFVAGLRLRTLIWAGLAALPLFYHLMVGTPFRAERLCEECGRRVQCASRDASA